MLSWVYVLAGAGMGMNAFEMTRMTQPVGVSDSAQSSMQGMSTGDTAIGGMMVTRGWTLGYAIVIFFMWWVMMFGMMLPSASPMLLLFARMMRKEKKNGTPYVPTGVFALGYLAIWAVFSAIATGVQWGLESSGLLSSIMVGTSAVLGAPL